MRRVQDNDKISGFCFYFPREKQQKRQKQIRELKEDHGGGNGQVVWCSVLEWGAIVNRTRVRVLL